MTKVILAVDPGKATGIALFEFTLGEEPVLKWAGEFQQDEVATPIRNAIDHAYCNGLELDVTCERFIINAQTVRNSQAPFSLEVIGALKQLLIDAEEDISRISFQSPSDAKAMFDNPKLKKLEYWHKGGEGHALDAIRHGLLRCVKLGWKPTRLLQ